MRWLDRFVHLAKADAHGVLDSIEDRSLMLKQGLRDAELEVERKRGRHALLEEELERLERRATDLGERRSTLDADVRLAMERGEESLARFAIRRWLACGKRLEAVAATQREAHRQHAGLGASLEVQERELEELREAVAAELEELRARRDPGRASADTPESGPDPDAPLVVREEEIELEWLRRQTAHDELEASS